MVPAAQSTTRAQHLASPQPEKTRQTSNLRQQIHENLNMAPAAQSATRAQHLASSQPEKHVKSITSGTRFMKT